MFGKIVWSIVYSYNLILSVYWGLGYAFDVYTPSKVTIVMAFVVSVAFWVMALLITWNKDNR